MRTAPLPQGLLGWRRVYGVCRAGAERRTENVETCETPRARAPAAARVARPGPAGPETLSPGILPPGRHPQGSRRSPSQPSGSLSSGSRFSPQALWGGRRAFPAARRSSASQRLLLGAGVLSQRRLSKASFPARDDPLVPYGCPSPGRRPFPRRLSGALRLRLPRVCLRPLAAAGSALIAERIPRPFFTCSLGHPFSLVTNPARVIPD